MFRTLGLWRHAQKLSQFIDEDTRKALQAYADGVNQYISTHARQIPD